MATTSAAASTSRESAGAIVEWVLVQLEEERERPRQAHMGKPQAGPSDSESA